MNNIFSFQAERAFHEAQQDEVVISLWLLKMRVPFKQRQFFFHVQKIEEKQY